MNLRVAVVCGVLCSSLPPCGNKRAKLSNKKYFKRETDRQTDRDREIERDGERETE